MDSLKNLNSVSLVLSLLLFASIVLYIYKKYMFRINFDKFIKIYPGINQRSKVHPKFLSYARYVLYCMVTILFIFAILNPSFEESKPLADYASQGVDILFMVDVSLSMNTVDTPPNRLSKFKETVLRMLPELSKNRLGILAFAGSPFLYCPMTDDIAAFADYIRGMDVDIIPNTGTDIRQAFDKASELMKSSKLYRNRILVLVTDGEDMKSSLPGDISANLIVWAVGTENGGHILFKDEENGISGYVTKSGQLTNNFNNPDLIVSKLNSTLLRQLASDHSADYVNLTENPEEASKLTTKVNSMNKNIGTYMRKLNQKDGFQYFLYPALFLLLLDITVLDFWLKRKLSSN